MTVVRTSVPHQQYREIEITLERKGGGKEIKVPVGMVSLSEISQMEGIIVITAKAYANSSIAIQLQSLVGSSPIVILCCGTAVY